MSDDVLITPASRKIEFKDSGGNVDGLIALSAGGNLQITSTGTIEIGDISEDIHIGNGTEAVDLVFDFASRIYSAANQDLTIGKGTLGGNNVTIDGATEVLLSLAGTTELKLTDDFLSLTPGNEDVAGYAFRSRNDLGMFESGYFCAIKAPESVFIQIDSNANNTDKFFAVQKDGSGMGNGTELFRVQENGKVGVGTASPTGKLTITDSGHDMIHLNRTVNNEGYGMGIIGRAGNSSSTTAAHEYAGIFLQIEDNTADSEAGSIAFNTSSGGTAADAGGTHAMQITSAGKVGIGTTSPGRALSVRTESADHRIAQVNRAASDTAALYLGNDSSNNAWVTGNNADLIFGKDVSGTKTEYMRVDVSTGRVGIGTTSPATALEVAGDISGERLNLEKSSGYATLEMGGSSGAFIDMKNPFSDDFDARIITDGTGLDIIAAGSGNHVTLKTNGTERFQVEDATVTSSVATLLHKSSAATQVFRLHADTDSSPAPRIEMMRGAHDTWGTGDNYCDWRITNENDLIFYSGFSTQSSGAAVERFRIHSDADGVTINNAYKFPASDGSANQVLQTNGSGVLSFATVSGGGSVDADANLAGNPKWTVTSTSGIGLELYRNQSASNMDQDLVRIRDDSQYSDQAVLRVIHDGVDQMNAADHSKICGALWVQSIGDATHQWPMTVANTINANQDGYGVGIKLKLSGVGTEDESKKWSGIGARGDDGSTYGRPTGMMFWTKTGTTASTTPSEKMYLTGAGNLGIGITAASHIIHVNGQGRATNSAWATSSDMRVKENIIELDGTLDTINSLRPVKFDYIDGKKEQVNFIAQEFKEVIPDAVTLTEEQGLDDFHVLDTSMLVPMLVKAVQELTVKVEQLEARLDG